ncbi:hypothetical protein K438DRAFT_1960199 [Mycena galopus ATCC 62051]|nr:hypothetical protein K438DRAFT_1960199 [Mycena galopus ATCC 62051]
MQFKLNFITLVAAAMTAVVVSAVPVAHSARAADVDGYVYICTDEDFAGDCDNYGFNSGVCSNFPVEFQNDISSWGPDQGWECIMYTEFNCGTGGETYTGTSPGFSTLPPGINDALNSVLCFPQN